MSQQIISKAERIRLFLHEYYFEQTAWIKIVRLIGGPLIIFASAQFYFNSHRSAVAYSGFCFLYGTYYIIKPLLIISRPRLFQAINFNLVVNGEKITFQEADASSQIQFKVFKKILRRGNYYSLKLPEKATIYLRADQLEEGERNPLNKHLTA